MTTSRQFKTTLLKKKKKKNPGNVVIVEYVFCVSGIVGKSYWKMKSESSYSLSKFPGGRLQ